MVALVLIALLPKLEGGFRPIGLVPFLPQPWMRARRRMANAWEETQQRHYLYAGGGTVRMLQLGSKRWLPS